MREVTSRHIGGAAELMLIVPVRSGNVATTGVTYAERLRKLLKALGDARQATVEVDGEEGRGPIESLRSIYNTQWSVVEIKGDPMLVVSACFDRSWEDYVALLVARTGDILDAIFSHCQGFVGRSCKDGVEAFSNFLHEHQIQTSFFHTELHDTTVDDVRLTRKHRTQKAGSDEVLQAANLIIKSPVEEQAHIPNRSSTATDIILSLALDYPPVTEVEGEARLAFDFFENAAKQLQPPKVPVEFPKPSDPPPMLDEKALESIQGGLLTPYEQQTHGVALFYGFGDRGREFLQKVTKLVTTQAAARAALKKLDTPVVNVFLTYPGLQRLGLDDKTLALFPEEFREGMQSRAHLIGDLGPVNEWLSKPGERAEDKAIQDVDIVIVAQINKAGGANVDFAEGKGHPLYEIVQDWGLGPPLHHQALFRSWITKGNESPYFKEHFGFRDSGNPGTGTQPVPNVVLEGVDSSSNDRVNLGEFLLGYPDTRERTSRAANVAPALFKNGSFLAMRKLEQHVERFEEYASAMGGAKEGCPYSAAGKNAATLSKEHVKSLIVGRDYDTGESLAANGRNTNAFTFEDKDDPGREVPLFSHTRRTNPRTPGDPIPRILRRSFSFGPPPPDGDGAERGLLFMAYNAHIGRQFEVLQRWINGSNITGLSSRQNDLLCGAPSPGARRFAKKDGCVYEFVAPQQPFVTLHWGMYLFAPSREALATLAGEDGQTGTMGLNAPRAPEPSATMKMLLGINANKATARATWKWLLEGDYTKKDAIAAWTAIRDEAGGVFVAEEYGLLVGTVVGAKAVLGDDGTKFSVREYLRRMQDTIGRHYLGLDLTRGKPVEGGGTYEELSARANAYIPGIIDEKPFEGGQAYAAEALQLLLPPGASFGADVDTLKTFAAMVVGRLAQTWLGLPLPPDAPLPVVAELIGAFALISQCTFQPYPDAVLVEESKEAGKKLVAAYRNEKGGVQGGLAQHLRGRSADRNAADVAVIGAIIGFAAPAIQCIVTALLRLSTHPRIEEIKGHRSGSDERRQFVRQFLAEFLSAVPVPSILYRTLVDRTSVTLFGERHEVDAGTLVVLGLQSLVADAALTVQSNDPPVRLLWMFGGEHHGAEGGAGKPVHGCPAREPVLLAIAGVLDAALDKV